MNELALFWQRAFFVALVTVIHLTTSDQPDEPFALPSDFPGIIVGSAIIVPSSTLQDPPSLDIKGIQANVSASIGRTAFLECKVKNLGHKSVSWVRHKDVNLISVGKFKYISDERFSIIHEDHDETWVLTIKDLKQSDEGFYECQVNASPLLRHRIHLNVVEPYTEILGGKDVFIDQHSALNLTCVIHAPEPPAHIFWIHDDHAVSESSSIQRTSGDDFTTSSLFVAYASQKDSGVYKCNPSNTGSASINVHVLDGESPDALQTSGLPTFMACHNTLMLIWLSVWTFIILAI